MATRAKDIQPIRTFGDNAWVITWTGLTNATSDDGSPFEGIGANDRSVQIFGTFGAGGTLRIEGSNDGTNWAVLTDPQGNALDFTSAKIEAITELVRYIRPRITGGDANTDLTCVLVARRSAA